MAVGPHTRGGAKSFPTGGLTLPTRGLKYGFQGTINAKNLRKNRFSPSHGGLACSNGGYSPLALPWLHPCPTPFRCLDNEVTSMFDFHCFATAHHHPLSRWFTRPPCVAPRTEQTPPTPTHNAQQPHAERLKQYRDRGRSKEMSILFYAFSTD